MSKDPDWRNSPLEETLLTKFQPGKTWMAELSARKNLTIRKCDSEIIAMTYNPTIISSLTWSRHTYWHFQSISYDSPCSRRNTQYLTNFHFHSKQHPPLFITSSLASYLDCSLRTFTDQMRLHCSPKLEHFPEKTSKPSNQPLPVVWFVFDTEPTKHDSSLFQPLFPPHKKIAE